VVRKMQALYNSPDHLFQRDLFIGNYGERKKTK